MSMNPEGITRTFIQKTPSGCRTVGKAQRRPLSAPVRDFQPDMQSLHLASLRRIGCDGQKLNENGVRVQRKTRARSASLATTRRGSSKQSLLTGIGDNESIWEFYKLQDLDEEEEPVKEEPPGTQSQRLYLSACKKLNEVPSTSFYKGLTKKEVNLRGTGLTTKGVRACSVALLENGSVEKADFGDNELQEKGTKQVAEMLKENDCITDLNMSDNKLQTEGAAIMRDLMKANDYIRKLDLSGNNLQEKDGALIAEILRENFTLRDLNLSHNCFRVEGGRAIGKALADNAYLEVLDLSWNHLRQDGATSIGAGLSQNLGLRKVNLAWNGFHLEGSKVIMRALTMNTTMVELDLAANRIDRECLDYILRGLRRNETLVKLCLSSNPLTMEGAVAIAETIKKTPTIALRDIDISTQAVNTDFQALYTAIRRDKVIYIRAGSLIRPDQAAGHVKIDDPFVNEDPMMVMMEYMRLKNFRLMDLFKSMDADGSGSLSKEEMCAAFQMAAVPLSQRCLDKLITILDKDGDGEVDFTELVQGQKEHRRKVSKMKAMRAKDTPFEETDLGRISYKLQTIMALRQIQRKHEQAKRRMTLNPAIKVTDEQKEALTDIYKNSLAAVAAGLLPKIPGGNGPGSRRASTVGSRRGSAIQMK